MATKKFIGTTYLGGKGGSGGSYNTGTSLLHNGMVSYNATSQGAPSSNSVPKRVTAPASTSTYSFRHTTPKLTCLYRFLLLEDMTYSDFLSNDHEPI